MRKRLRKLTGGKINMATRSKLVKAIKAAIIDWEVSWTPEAYPQKELQKGELFTKRERNALSARVFHGIRGLVW